MIRVPSISYFKPLFTIVCFTILIGCSTHAGIVGLPGEIDGPKPKKKDIDLTKETPFKHAPPDTEYQLISEQIISNDTIKLNEYLSDVPVQIDANTGVYVKQGYVTNKEYREFIRYVRDSIFREVIVNELEAHEPNNILAGDPPYSHTPYVRPMVLDWDDHFCPWCDEEISILRSSDVMEPIQYPYFYNGYTVYKLNTSKLIYTRSASRDLRFTFTDSFDLITEQIYPDTLLWLNSDSMQFAHRTSIAAHYLWNPHFDDYPVVGLDRADVDAFLHWKTKLHNQYLNRQGGNYTVTYTLPAVTLQNDDGRPAIAFQQDAHRWVISGQDYLNFMNYCRDSLVRRILSEDYNEDYLIDKNCYDCQSGILDWREPLSYDNPDLPNVLGYNDHLIKSKGEPTKYRFKPYYYRYLYIEPRFFDNNPDSLPQQEIVVFTFPDTAAWSSAYGSTYIGPTDTAHQKPMRGITYEQAVAFYHWKISGIAAQRYKHYRREKGIDFLIPSETQWHAVMQGKPLPEDESTFEIPGPFFRYQIVVTRR